MAVKGEGETKAYGLIGDNGSNTDGIWATGNNESAVARVYVGDSTIHLYPLTGNGTGLSGTGITSVELADSDQADGVTLVTTDLTDVTLSFESNFYDEIPLKITFEGGTVKYLTVIRVGLVIQYQYLIRVHHGGNSLRIIGTPKFRLITIIITVSRSPYGQPTTTRRSTTRAVPMTMFFI